MDRLRREFDQALSKHVIKPLESSVPTPPQQPDSMLPSRPLLYHYTTLSGLLGIIANSSIWASDVRYMNDASELTYAAEMIAAVVAETLESVEDEALCSALPKRTGFANAFEHGSRPFVACFCEEHDLLSQWRGYRGDEPGFSLGMDVPGIARVGGLPPNTHLRKVIYDENEQAAAVRAVTKEWLQVARLMIERGEDPSAVFPYPAIWALQGALTEHHLCFKHPAFAEEREWRLIKLVDVREEMGLVAHQRSQDQMSEAFERMREFGHEPPDLPDLRRWNPYEHAEGIEIRFRIAPAGLIPYVDIPLRERAGIFIGKLPLGRVVQGPTPNADLSLESVALCLQSRGYGFPHTEVRASDIPLRW